VQTDHLDLALLLLRLAIAFVMLAHGWNHIFRGGRIPGTARWFTSLGMRPGVLHAWLASGTELVVGVLLVLGLLTPLAAAGVVGVITVAWATNHVGNGFFIFREGEGWEWVATLALSSFALAVMGGGSWSLDDAIGLELDGAAALAAGALGPLAALGLLAAFWRPTERQRPNLPFVAAIFGLYAVTVGVGFALVGSGIEDAIVEPDQLSYGALVLRAVLAAVMFAHGWNHVFGGGRIPGTARWFTSLGMRPGVLHAWLASLTELGVALLLVLGLLTPLAAAGVVGVLTVAWITNHAGNGYFTFRPGEGWEYVSFLCVAALALGAIGGGEWSLDRALDLDADVFRGFNGFFAALSGALAAIVLLALFWRPERMKSPRGAAAVVALYAVLALVGVMAATAAGDGEGAAGHGSAGHAGTALDRSAGPEVAGRPSHRP
jgi:putative oxidoreductase